MEHQDGNLDKSLYWIWLQQLFGPGSHRINALSARFGTAEEIYGMSREERQKSRCFTPNEIDKLERTPLDKARAAVERCRLMRCGILTPEDEAYPERLRHIYAMPAVLYTFGDVSALNGRPVITMVGKRDCTDYGRRAAATLSSRLVHYGAAVASGCAVGIDAACMEAALEQGGRVIGVMGCGIDHPYPRQNIGLLRRVARRGLLLSEYPPGTPPYRGNFPIRNRILSGIGLGTVVVEAAKNSGSLITAAHALEQGKDVFAVPARIDDETFHGTLDLIRQGAKMVCCAEDILCEYEHLFPNLSDLMRGSLPAAEPARPPEPESPSETEEDRFASVEDEEQRRICRVLVKGTASAQALAEQTGLSISSLLPALTELEIAGKIVQEPGRRYTLSHGDGTLRHHLSKTMLAE